MKSKTPEDYRELLQRVARATCLSFAPYPDIMVERGPRLIWVRVARLRANTASLEGAP